MAADFCTPGDLKDWLGIAGSKDDALLASLITNVTAAMLNKMNRADVLSASYTEVRNGNGGSRLALKNFPVTAVTSLKINGAVIPASPDSIQAGYVFDQYQLSLIGSSFLWPGNSPGSSFGVGANNITVIYTAGYASLPADLKQACIDWCAFRYRQKSWIGQTSKHLGTGETVSFSQKDMPDSVAAVIQQYSRRIPV